MEIRNAASRLDSGSSIRNTDGSPHHRPAERDALALAAGQLTRAALQKRRDLEFRRRIADAAVDLGAIDPSHPQAEGDILVDRLVRIKRIALKHHRDIAADAAAGR